MSKRKLAGPRSRVRTVHTRVLIILCHLVQHRKVPNLPSSKTGG